MALTSTTTLDLVGQTSTISFFEGASMVDQLSFGSGAITYQAISSYNLSKSDMALHFNFLNAFLTLLYINFPIVSQSTNLAWPLCLFEISLTSSGVEHITYTQSSQGTTFLTIDYVPIAQAGSFIARASPVTITLQEFINGLSEQKQFFNQVSLN